MDYIEFLGTCGTRTSKQGATCIKIAKDTVIDAGNLINSSMEDITQINNIFLTHAHLDHISDIPFLIEELVVTATKALKIYALKDTIEALKSYVFNNKIWPDFSTIKLLHAIDNTLEFIEIEIDTIYEIEDFSIMPVKTNHTDGSCGYIVKKNKQGIFITADTYVSDEIWKKLNQYTWIHSLCIDVSFSSDQEQLAYDSKHLTPQLLSKELKKLNRDNLSIYPMHLKPFFYKQIVDELSSYEFMKSNNSKILLDGDKIFFDKQIGISHSSKNKIDRLIGELANISVALSSEKNIEHLLELILSKAKKMTNADGGTLYLLNQKSKMLEFKVVQTDSLNIKMGGKSGEITWNALPLYHKDGSKNSSMVAVVSALEDKIINIEDVYFTDKFDFSGTKIFDKQTGYRSQSMLVIPLKNHEDMIIGVLQLINKKSKYLKTTTFSSFDEKLANALASEAAVALTKQQLIDDLENLLESFLHSINIAIEKKSKYTAGHIEKMVEITTMLADAVNSNKSVFKDKNYSEQELKQIKLAALMHDVGKISTPEYVVDKATKLQTIYDRIESVKLKAQIRKRDLEIEYLKKSIDASREQKEVLYSDYLISKDKIDKELLFLQEANRGSEFFNDENIEKVSKIAKAKIEIDGIVQNWLSSDELMNLTIQKGTLNDNEREIINNHATVSLEMLRELPFPKKYARVAEIAAAHHEQINGKGYPLGLKGDKLSFEARILAVADIFEALTASDRPYKKAKKLSESMKILYFMAKDDHIDKDIVKFLYDSGLYLKIAKKIIPKEYIDECFIDFEY
jgi:HD-GYP domain-containing protein (c-di-GMP phosphodiesterase class II)/ribonuclease BN (tRNA processing enzyme)